MSCAGSAVCVAGIRRLGDSIVVGMEDGWHAVPPAARLVAYVAALAGAFFLLRSRAPSMDFDDKVRSMLGLFQG